jgi:hypothetical protein
MWALNWVLKSILLVLSPYRSLKMWFTVTLKFCWNFKRICHFMWQNDCIDIMGFTFLKTSAEISREFAISCDRMVAKISRVLHFWRQFVARLYHFLQEAWKKYLCINLAISEVEYANLLVSPTPPPHAELHKTLIQNLIPKFMFEFGWRSWQWNTCLTHAGIFVGSAHWEQTRHWCRICA